MKRVSLAVGGLLIAIAQTVGCGGDVSDNSSPIGSSGSSGAAGQAGSGGSDGHGCLNHWDCPADWQLNIQGGGKFCRGNDLFVAAIGCAQESCDAPLLG
jgi:hypothetical protein